MQEARRETLRAGPGEAARQAVAVGESGPAPSRWTLRTVRVSVEGRTGSTVSGGWRVLQACGLGVHASGARWFSPAPAYHRKVPPVAPLFAHRRAPPGHSGGAGLG